MVKIAPSILAANFKNLEDEIKSIVQAGADLIHVDIMDGKFVKNKTPGMEMYEIAERVSNVPIDTHLMVENPEEWVNNIINVMKKNIEANDKNYKRNIISFHIESVNEITAYRIIKIIHNAGIKVGIAIKPSTKLEEILPFLPIIDMALIMTVEPGYGGQVLIKSCLEKVSKLRKLEPNIDIEVDGGINLETVKEAKNAGANVIVAGTAIFNTKDRTSIIKQFYQ